MRLTIVSNEPEAELVCGVLRGSDIRCMHRITDLAFGSGGELAMSGAGPREVLVMSEQLELAQRVLAEQLAAGDSE